jgi:hypothetical protein
LRGDHPLVQRTAALHHTARNWTYVAAVLTGSLIARVEGQRWAAGLVSSAGCVLALLSLLLLLRVQERRDCVIDLIMQGNEDLPIEMVQRARRRLIAARNRRGLARNLEELADQAVAYRTRRGGFARPLYEPGVVAEVVNELRELSAVLQTGHVSPRGVAAVERLVRRGSSSLYGRDVAALRGELYRVGTLLREQSE